MKLLIGKKRKLNIFFCQIKFFVVNFSVLMAVVWEWLFNLYTFMSRKKGLRIWKLFQINWNVYFYNFDTTRSWSFHLHRPYIVFSRRTFMCRCFNHAKKIIVVIMPRLFSHKQMNSTLKQMKTSSEVFSLKFTTSI